MIEQTAIVTDCEGDYVQVKTEGNSGCNSCAVREGCGTATVAEAMEKGPTLLRALNPIGAKPGERVVIGIEEAALNKISAAFYAVPLACLILFALAGQFLAPSLGASAEPMSALGGFLGLVFGLLFLQRFVARTQGDQSYQITVLRRAHGMPITPCVK